MSNVVIRPPSLEEDLLLVERIVRSNEEKGLPAPVLDRSDTLVQERLLPHSKELTLEIVERGKRKLEMGVGAVR